MAIVRTGGALPRAGARRAGRGGDDRLHQLPRARRQPQRRRQRLPPELRPDPGEPALLARPLLQRPGLGRPGGRRLPRRGPADRQPRLGRRQRRGRRPRRPRPRDAGGALPRARRGPGRRPAARGDLDRRQRHPRRSPARAAFAAQARGVAEAVGDVATGLLRSRVARLPDPQPPRHRRDPEVRRRSRRRPLRDPRHQGLQPRARRPDRGAARRRRPRQEGERLRPLQRPARPPEALRRAQHHDPLPRRGRQSLRPPAGPAPRLLRRDPPEPGGAPAHRRGGDGQDRPARRHARRRRPRRRSAARRPRGCSSPALLSLAGLGARYQRSSRGPSTAPSPVTARIASPYQMA